jgi:hypothetical protein
MARAARYTFGVTVRAGIVVSLACAFVACTGGSAGFGPYVYDDPDPATRESPGRSGSESPATSNEDPGSSTETPATSGENPGLQGGGGANCPPCDLSLRCAVPISAQGKITTYTASAKLDKKSAGCTLDFTDQGTDEIPPIILACDGTLQAEGQKAGTWKVNDNGAIVIDIPSAQGGDNGIAGPFNCTKSTSTTTTPPTPTPTSVPGIDASLPPTPVVDAGF